MPCNVCGCAQFARHVWRKGTCRNCGHARAAHAGLAENDGDSSSESAETGVLLRETGVLPQSPIFEAKSDEIPPKSVQNLSKIPKNRPQIPQNRPKMPEKREKNTEKPEISPEIPLFARERLFLRHVPRASLANRDDRPREFSAQRSHFSPQIPENDGISTENDGISTENDGISTENGENLTENGENAEISPENAEISPENAEISPKNGEIPPENVDFGEISAEIDEISYENSENEAEIAENAPIKRLIVTTLGGKRSKTAENARKSPEIGQKTAENTENDTQNTEFNTKNTENDPKMAENDPKSTQNGPKTPKMASKTRFDDDSYSYSYETTSENGSDSDSESDSDSDSSSSREKIAEKRAISFENSAKMDENLGKMDDNLGTMDENLQKTDENSAKMDENGQFLPENGHFSPENGGNFRPRSDSAIVFTENPPKTAEIAENDQKMTENGSKTTENGSKMTENDSKTPQNDPKTAEMPVFQMSAAALADAEAADAQISAQIGRNTRKAPENDAKTAENDPKMAENGPKTTENGEISPKMARKTPFLGRGTTFYLESAFSIREPADFDEITAENGPNSSKIGENSEKMSENGSKITENGLKMDENPSKMGENPTKMGENTSKMGENPSKSADSDLKKRKWLQRARVEKEILGTERTYVRLLGHTIEQYQLPLEQSLHRDRRPIIPAALVRGIFGNIADVLAVNNGILAALEKCGTGGGTIAEVFLEAIPRLEVYVKFVIDFERSLSTLSKAKTLKRFEHFLAKVAAKEERELAVANPDAATPPRAQDLSSLLILPVQRIPRYELLLRELLRLTPEEHREHGLISKSLEMIRGTAVLINARKEESDNLRVLVCIQSRFNILDEPLVREGRRLIRAGKLTKKPSSGAGMHRRRHFILLNDALIFAARNKRTDRFDLKGTIDLSTSSVRDIPNTPEFEVISKRGQFVIYAEDESTKTEWLNDLRACIEHSVSSMIGLVTGAGPAEMARRMKNASVDSMYTENP